MPGLERLRPHSTFIHAMSTTALLFVYGSLKEGFPNFHYNKGRRIQGDFRTIQPYPLFLAEGRLPCLLPLPGRGLQVVGQLFEVNEAELALMDELERVGEPGGYARVPIAVEALHDPTHGTSQAFAYTQSQERMASPGPHVGPIAEYTLEHAKTLRW